MLMDVGKYESRGLTMLKMHFSKTRLYQVKPNHWKVRVWLYLWCIIQKPFKIKSSTDYP